MIDSAFDWFNDLPVEIPVRSRLNPICPIGRGTGLVQGLPSYIHHLAASHSLPTWTLVCRIIAPEFSRKTVATKHGHCDLFGKMGASTLGNNQTAAQAVAILEKLSSVAGLDALTLLKFGKSVAGPLKSGARLGKIRVSFKVDIGNPEQDRRMTHGALDHRFKVLESGINGDGQDDFDTMFVELIQNIFQRRRTKQFRSEEDRI